MEGGPRVYRFFAEVPIYTRICVYVFICICMLCTYTNATRAGNEKARENRNGKLSRNDIASYRRLATGEVGEKGCAYPPKDETSGYILTSGIDCGQEMVCVSA